LPPSAAAEDKQAAEYGPEYYDYGAEGYGDEYGGEYGGEYGDEYGQE
jgi:hypothetical protein